MTTMLTQLETLLRSQGLNTRKVAVSTAAIVGIATFIRQYQIKQAVQRQYNQQQKGKTAKQLALEKSKKVAVDKIFLQRLRKLLAIVLPSWNSKEALLLGFHSCFLVSRTFLSIYVAKLDGSIVKSIVDRNFQQWYKLMIAWMLIAIPSTYVNSLLLFLESKLSLAFRSRLTYHLYKEYMSDDTYYRVVNLDNRISNPDQCLTEDVNSFCSDLAHLYSHLSKPMLDVALMTSQLVILARKRGGSNAWTPMFAGIAMCIGTGYVLKVCAPPFGKLVAEQARRYGDLRAAHSRLIAASEEVSFYRGEKIEYGVLVRAYDHLTKHINFIYRQRIGYTMLEQFLMRYVWSAVGLSMIALPAFAREQQERTGRKAVATAGDSPTPLVQVTHPAAVSKDDNDDSVSGRTQDFVTARGLLLNAADAIERMMSSWKEITELAGRTARISEMLTIFEEVKAGHFEKSNGQKMIDDHTIVVEEQIEIEDDAVTEDIAQSSRRSLRDLSEAETRGLDGIKRNRSTVTLERQKSIPRKDSVDQSNDPVKPPSLQTSKSAPAKPTQKKSTAVAQPGKVIDGCNYIDCQDVAIVTPNGDTLIESLSFKIDEGMHLLIVGPNGCGKSSLFRLIGGIWPVTRGTLHKPSRTDVFYIPQKPYLTNGNFREQFIYPDTSEDFFAKGHSDKDLDRIIDIVALKHVVAREGGLDSTADWRDVLSGGEKQRTAMARLFYHKPRFAILDECTSAVSIDVEGQMYTAAKDSGITLMTVTHRPTLYKYHTQLLQFDGQGGYKFSSLDAGQRLSLREEKEKLEDQLKSTAANQKRLRELVEILGESSVYASADISINKH